MQIFQYAFPVSQFYEEGFTMPDGFDKDRNGGGVMINVREDTPSKIFEKH